MDKYCMSTGVHCTLCCMSTGVHCASWTWKSTSPIVRYASLLRVSGVAQKAGHDIPTHSISNSFRKVSSDVFSGRCRTTVSKLYFTQQVPIFFSYYELLFFGWLLTSFVLLIQLFTVLLVFEQLFMLTSVSHRFFWPRVIVIVILFVTLLDGCNSWCINIKKKLVITLKKIIR